MSGDVEKNMATWTLHCFIGQFQFLAMTLTEKDGHGQRRELTETGMAQGGVRSPTLSTINGTELETCTHDVTESQCYTEGD